MAAKIKANNSVDDEEIARFSAMAASWWDEKGKFKPLHDINPLRLQFIRDHAIRHFSLAADGLRPLSGLSLLDIGCGGGLIAEPMARMGANVTAIDASEKNIAVAQLHAKQSGLAIDYRCTAAEDLATGGAQYDIVLALEIIEHVADVEIFLNACHALVKPGGMLVITTLNRTTKSYALAIIGAEYVLRWLPRGTHTWSKFIKPSELAAHLRRLNLSLVETTGMTLNPLNGQWRLNPRDLGVNYLMVVKKP